MAERLTAKLMRWLIFSVVLALVPLAFTALRLSTRGDSPSLLTCLLRAISRGELLLIAAILCGRSSGELVGSGTSYRISKTISAGGAVILLMLAALYFADVTAAQLSGQHIEAALVQKVSLILFVCGLFCSASCLTLAELQ